MKKFLNIAKKTIGLMATSLIWINITYAGQITNIGEAETQLKEHLIKIFSFVFGAAGAIFVVMFIVGGIQYLTSAGNEEAATKAKKLLINAVIGIIIIVCAYAGAAWILTSIGGTIPNVIKPT